MVKQLLLLAFISVACEAMGQDAPSVRTADATDIGLQLLARYGQNDREIVLGQTNYFFAGSDSGGIRAAKMYTLIEIAKLNGLDSEAYLRDTSRGPPITRST
jgi:hypothetical protein